MTTFGVLGPLTISRDGRPVPLAATMLRRLAAVLICRAGQSVSASALVDSLWDGAPPPSARKTLQVYVHRLRHALDDDTRVRHGSAGYSLVVGEDELDALVFAELATQGRVARQQRRLDRAHQLLRQSLSLWRGAPYADVTVGPLIADEVRRLEEQRLLATQEWAAIALDLGRHADLVPELTGLATAHPYREQLQAYLMLALYRCGRQVEALDLFRQTRAAFVEHLGVEPTAVLQRLHEAILRGDDSLAQTVAADLERGEVVTSGATVRADEPATARPATVPPPHQLPADGAGFAGRATALHALDEALEAHRGTVVISAIAGMAGVGKTALAVRWAHRIAARFPDGQLYVNLRGYAAGPPMRPIEALTVFLPAIGVAAEAVPVDLDEAIGLYRTMLADRRMLVLLDNARDAEQVRPLLPAGPHCLAVVTSRDRLTGLVALQNARRLTLDVLDPAESTALLTDVLGAARATTEPAAVAALANACGHLPLALRIAAANLVDRPHQSIAAYVGALRSDNVLAELEVSGDAEASVRAAFALSYQALAPDAQRLFRLLSIAVGGDITAEAAAALAGCPVDRARALLDALTAAHLVGQERAGRFTLHDLLRSYSAEQAAAEQTTNEHAALRLGDFYLHAIDAAARLLYPHVVRIPVGIAASGVPAVDLVDDAAAQAWLDAELPNLVVTIEHTAQHGPRRTAWLLADALRGYFWIRRNTVEWLATGQAGLAAATADGDDHGLAATHMSCGLAHRSLARYATAIEHLEAALAAGQRSHWLEVQASALGSLGTTHAEVGELRLALGCLDEALALNRKLGRREGEGVVLGNMGTLRYLLGDLRQSTVDATEALARYRDSGSVGGEALILSNLGSYYVYLGQPEPAVEHLAQGLALQERIGDRYGKTVALAALTKLHCDAGRHAQAREYASTLVAIARETGDRNGEAGALVELARLHCALGDAGAALDDGAEALRIARATDSKHSEVRALIGLGEALLLAGRLGEAQDRAEEAFDLARERSYRLLEGDALTTVAAVHRAQGSRARARASADAALVCHRDTGYRYGEVRARAILASVTDDPDAAERHRRDVMDLAAAIGVPVPAELPSAGWDRPAR